VTVFRLLATGSRDYSDWRTAGRVFGEELTQLPAGTTFIVVHGACPDGGLDQIADRWARSPTIAGMYPDYTIVAEPHPADWRRDCDEHCRHRPRKPGGRCPAAGPLRNQLMVDLGADKCVAFPLGDGWSGTRDCMRRAVKAGIAVREIGCRDAATH
jgi:hypothetical protein